MTSKRITPLLLAASVFLTGATGAFLGAMTPAHAITSVDELSDINRNHWAFEALRDLVEKYDVIEGYPDHTFRGDRTPTRWEMAAALNALIRSVGKDLARIGAEKADKKDLATLARLQEEFRQELKVLTERVGALEARATAIEAKNVEQDNRLTLLEKTQIHGDFTIGGLADISQDGTHSRTNGRDSGIRDALSAVGRLRLAINAPVYEGNDDWKLGEGTVYARLIGAIGRNAPLGTQDGNLGAYTGFNGYSRIAGDASAFNEGIGTRAGNINGGIGNGSNTRTNLYIETAYYKQHFKSGIPLLTDFFPGMGGVLPDGDDWKATGDMYVGIIPWRFLFDKSPYRGNELTQFQNTSFINTPGIQVNQNMPMVAYQWHQGLGKSAGLDLTTAVASSDVGDVYDGMNVTYEARLNYLTSFLGKEYTKPGALYAGGYHIWNSGNRSQFANSAYVNRIGGTLGAVPLGTTAAAAPTANTLGRQNDTNAFYVGMNQELYKGIGLSASYMFTNNSRSSVAYTSLNQTLGANTAFIVDGIGVAPQQALSAVMTIPMAALVPGFRDKDGFGVGYSATFLQQNGIRASIPDTVGFNAPLPTAVTNFGTSGVTTTQQFGNRNQTKAEQVAEFFYRFQLNDSVSIVPSFQLIFNRLGLKDNGMTSVIGFRTNYTF
jgi:hypothetical protein